LVLTSPARRPLIAAVRVDVAESKPSPSVARVSAVARPSQWVAERSISSPSRMRGTAQCKTLPVPGFEPSRGHC
jgi:hypothetical protein